MTVFGPKRTSKWRRGMSAIGGKADCNLIAPCPLLTQSRHLRFTIAAVQLDPEPHFVDRKSLL